VGKAASNGSVAGKLLAARRALRGTEWDGSDLDHFVQVLCRLDADRHGFSAIDLLAVEAAWIGAAGETWSGGLVARLKDGRRVHVDGRAGARTGPKRIATLRPARWRTASSILNLARGMAGGTMPGTTQWCAGSMRFWTGFDAREGAP
jgi:hypothetical protein